MISSSLSHILYVHQCHRSRSTRPVRKSLSVHRVKLIPSLEYVALADMDLRTYIIWLSVLSQKIYLSIYSMYIHIETSQWEDDVQRTARLSNNSVCTLHIAIIFSRLRQSSCWRFRTGGEDRVIRPRVIKVKFYWQSGLRWCTSD